MFSDFFFFVRLFIALVIEVIKTIWLKWEGGVGTIRLTASPEVCDFSASEPSHAIHICTHAFQPGKTIV